MEHNRKDWSKRLDDTLWAYQAYITLIKTTHYKLVYGKSCNLSVKLEHKAHWAIKAMNFDIAQAREQRKLQLNELDD